MSRRVLILSPAFHGIWRGIVDAFDRLGYTPSVSLFDAHPSLGSRVAHQATHQFPLRLGIDRTPALRTRATASALEALRLLRPDAVLVVKGDVLLPEFWAALDSAGIPRLRWLYDDVHRIGVSVTELVGHGPVATFSRSNANEFADHGIESHYLPLAFDTSVPVEPRASIPAVTFAGARYDYREELLLAVQAAGVPVRVYGRDWSGHAIDRLRTWSVHRPDLPAERDVDRARMYAILGASAAALNIHDGVQDGFNLRTFETGGVGGVQLIDRPDVSEFYDPGAEVLVYRSADEVAEYWQRLEREPAWAGRIRAEAQTRTLAEHTMVHRVEAVTRWWD